MGDFSLGGYCSHWVHSLLPPSSQKPWLPTPHYCTPSKILYSRRKGIHGLNTPSPPSTLLQMAVYAKEARRKKILQGDQRANDVLSSNDQWPGHTFIFLFFMYPNTIRKVKLFLDYWSCVQGSLKKLKGGIFLHYFIYKLEACEIQSRLGMKWSLPPPPSPRGSVECRHSELDAIACEPAVVHSQGLRFCKCNEFWRGLAGPKTPPLKMMSLQLCILNTDT